VAQWLAQLFLGSMDEVLAGGSQRRGLLAVSGVTRLIEFWITNGTAGCRKRGGTVTSGLGSSWRSEMNQAACQSSLGFTSNRFVEEKGTGAMAVPQLFERHHPSLLQLAPAASLVAMVLRESA